MFQSRRISFLLLLLVSLGGACEQEPYPVVDLDRVDAGVEQRPPAARPLLRVSVAAMVSPLSAHEHYSQLVDLIGARVGREVRFYLRKSYAEVNKMLLAGEVDLAFLCTGGYLHLLRRAPGLKPLCIPQVGGKDTYRSYLLVSANSSYREFGQLRGKHFAFTDPLSQTGCLWPSYLVGQLGTTPGSFFDKITYTGSHDRSIRAVAQGLVDAAAVDSLVFEQLVRSEPRLTDRVRILSRSPEFGMPPVVASPRLDSSLREHLRRIMLHLHEDEQGRRLLELTGIERFVPASEGLYDSARRVLEEMEGRQP